MKFSDLMYYGLMTTCIIIAVVLNCRLHRYNERLKIQNATLGLQIMQLQNEINRLNSQQEVHHVE